MSDTAVNYRPLAAGDRLGEWRLDARLGENESGDVWSVRHHALDRRAAVIVATDPVQAAVLRACGEAHQKVSHPRVVQTLGLDLDHQPPYLVLGWVDGESLRDRMDRSRLLTSEAVRVVEEMLEGLEAAHALRICHGALRPERVLLEGGIDVRLSVPAHAREASRSARRRPCRSRVPSAVGLPQPRISAKRAMLVIARRSGAAAGKRLMAWPPAS